MNMCVYIHIHVHTYTYVYMYTYIQCAYPGYDLETYEWILGEDFYDDPGEFLGYWYSPGNGMG